MKVHCRKLTKAEAIAESKAALAAQRRLMRKWERQRARKMSMAVTAAFANFGDK